jgi:hypothetical protein
LLWSFFIISDNRCLYYAGRSKAVPGAPGYHTVWPTEQHKKTHSWAKVPRRGVRYQATLAASSAISRRLKSNDTFPHSEDAGGCLTYRRSGGHAEGRVNLDRAGSIGRGRISRWGGGGGGRAGRLRISRHSCGGGGGALQRWMN